MVIEAINSNAEVVREEKILTSPKALEELFGSLNGPVQAGVEYTGFWYWLSDGCRDHNIPLTLAHSKMVKAISYAKVKTSKADAKTLAELLRAGLIPEACRAASAHRELRELTRGRLWMIRWRGKLQSTLWNLAAKYNVQISGRTQWRYPGKLQRRLQPQLPRRPTCRLNEC